MSRNNICRECACMPICLRESPYYEIDECQYFTPEVTTCKYCTFRVKDTKWCNMLGREIELNDYCSFAEKETKGE